MYFPNNFFKKRLIFSQIWNVLKINILSGLLFFRVSMETLSLCSVFKWNNKNVKKLIDRELSGFYLQPCTRSLTMNSNFCIPQSLVRYWNFSFIISEFVQVNPGNSLAECVNL